jgi:hypothetical protein
VIAPCDISIESLLNPIINLASLTFQESKNLISNPFRTSYSFVEFKISVSNPDHNKRNKVLSKNGGLK